MSEFYSKWLHLWTYLSPHYFGPCSLSFASSCCSLFRDDPIGLVALDVYLSFWYRFCVSSCLLEWGKLTATEANVPITRVMWPVRSCFLQAIAKAIPLLLLQTFFSLRRAADNLDVGHTSLPWLRVPQLCGWETLLKGTLRSENQLRHNTFSDVHTHVFSRGVPNAQNRIVPVWESWLECISNQNEVRSFP